MAKQLSFDGKPHALVQDIGRAIESGRCHLSCLMAGSNVCTCSCEKKYHGVGILLTFVEKVTGEGV